MGDPVTMAVVGGTIGAATNRKDPLKGALMGAAGGYAGGSLMGAGGAAGATGGGFAGGGYGSIGTAGATAGAGSGGMFSGMSNMFSGMPSSISGLGKDITSAPLFGRDGTISNINQAAGAYNQTMRALGYDNQPVQMPGGMAVQRGQIQPMDYMSLLNPQQQNVLRPASVSLL